MPPRQIVSVRRQVEITHAQWREDSRRRLQLRNARLRALAVHYTHSVNRQPIAQSRWTSYERLQELNRTMAFEPLTDEASRRLELEAQAYCADGVLDRKVCAVMDTWVYPKSAKHMKVNDLPFDAMRAVLTGQPWCTPAITEYYDCSAIDSRLEGMLLSRRSFDKDEDNEASVWISMSALNHLQGVATRLAHTSNLVGDSTPPRFSIADRFVAGTYQAIDDSTVVERQAIGLVQLRGVVKVIYGGPGNVLHSHLLCWDNRAATIASRVPTVVGRENFQLILAGPMTQPQELLLAKRHECSSGRVQQVHQLLVRVNPLYADVDCNNDFDGASCSGEAIATRLQADGDTERLITEARARQSSVARMQCESGDFEAQESTMIESQTLLMETTMDKTEADRLAHAVAVVTKCDRGYVARRSTTLLKSNDPHYMERLFPHLLTFGIGGFSTTRSHRYSHRAIVLHYLNLSTNRFAEDSMYKLVMFDYLSTARVKSGVFLRVGRDPALATTVMRISPTQLKNAMWNRAEQRKAWKLGRSFTPVPESNLATRCLKSINATASKMWGSNEEREAMARKVDAMSINFGAPSVFWTLTPNPDWSMTCAFWTGQPLPNGRPEKLAQCSAHNMPCSSEMARIIMTNTVVQAEYYRTCCHVLIDILFAWDTSTNKPKSQRGIFGFVEALVYALEQQGRLFIHHHGVAWIAGLPKTQSDWDLLLGNDELKRRFEQYSASIFAAELPVYDMVREVMCPRATCSGELSSVPIPKKYKHLLKASVTAPTVAKCLACEAEFSESDIVTNLIETQWNALSVENKAASSSQAVQTIRHRFGGLSLDGATSKVQLSRLLLKDQVHAFTHARSCIKGHTGTKCRYNFFRELVNATGFNKENEIVHRRRLGNQWLNPYIPIWRRIFHFNMDARVLWSGNSLQATRYAIQYTVKRQSVLDNVAVVEMAFKKRVEREATLETTEYARGVGRLLSLAYATSGVMELGGPLATAILLEGKAVAFSCSFERLVLVEGINMLNNTTVEALVVSRNQELLTETSIVKYMERPKCLELSSWYHFCSWFRRDGPVTTTSAHACTFTTNDDAALRAHLKKHRYHFFEYPRVPEIIGPRLPDATRLGNDDYADQSELYYRVAALLYHPFRDPTSILDSAKSAKAFFDTWNPFGNAVTSRALERHQQYYICLHMAQTYREKQREMVDANSDDDDMCVDDDVLHQAATQMPRSTNDYITIPGDCYAPDDNIPMGSDGEEESENDDDPTAAQELLLHSIPSSGLPPDESLVFTASNRTITRAQVSKFQQQSAEATNIPSDDHAGTRVAPGTTTVVIEAFERALQELSSNELWPAVPQIRQYASIRNISAHFKLNARQHVAFTLIAVPLLSKLSGVDMDESHARLFNRNPLIITGAGGTGKSQIIAAVRALARAWSYPDAIKVVASTGIAAASLEGCTMHSSVGLGLNVAHLPKHITSPTDMLLREWAPVRCVVADEVSMTNLAFFGLWEEALRHAKDALDDEFGGLILVLMFDHCQLRTVSGVPMYKKATDCSRSNPNEDRGRRLYQAINKVVYLIENMRFKDDPQWGEWLASARIGDWRPELKAHISSLSDRGIVHHHSGQGMIQTISTDNVTRSSVNKTGIMVAIRKLGQERKVYVVPARMSRQITPEELAILRHLPDNKTGNIPVFLHIYVGMPVRVKANQCVVKGVANGASGTVHHIDWEPSTNFALQPNGAWMASTQPSNIYINIANCPTPSRFPLLPPHWPSSVMPVVQVTSTILFQGPSLSIKGFPIIPAFGTTVHGVQGETRSAVAITNLRPRHVKCVDPHALYVALSRLRTRRGLHWIGERPTDEDYAYFRPNAEVLLEDSRLKHQSHTTIAEFRQLTRTTEV